MFDSGVKIPWRMEWLLTPVFLPREFHGHRSPLDYSPRSHKEWDMMETLILSLSPSFYKGVQTVNSKLFNSKGSFPSGLDDKAYNVGGPGSITGLGSSPGEGMATHSVPFLPGKSHGWRNLVGYSPWGHKESDRTERLHFHFHFFTLTAKETSLTDL